MNESAITPVEYKCLIRLDPVQEKTAGGILLPDDRKERDQMAATEATLLKVGGMAFHELSANGQFVPWMDPVPRPGQRVLVNKYAGQAPKSGDTRSTVRLCNDKDIIAVMEG